jgi:hypothetical protein
MQSMMLMTWKCSNELKAGGIFYISETVKMKKVSQGA